MTSQIPYTPLTPEALEKLSAWAEQHPTIGMSLPWERLDDDHREFNMRIGEAVAAHVRESDEGAPAVTGGEGGRLGDADWRQRVANVLMMNIGLIDDELAEATAAFLVREDWLIKGKPELTDRHVLLIAKAVGQPLARPDENASLREALKAVESERDRLAGQIAAVRAIAEPWAAKRDSGQERLAVRAITAAAILDQLRDGS